MEDQGKEIFSIIKYKDMIDFRVNTTDELFSPSEFQEILQQTFLALSHLNKLGIDSNITETIIKLQTNKE